MKIAFGVVAAVMLTMTLLWRARPRDSGADRIFGIAFSPNPEIAQQSPFRIS